MAPGHPFHCSSEQKQQQPQTALTRQWQMPHRLSQEAMGSSDEALAAVRQQGVTLGGVSSRPDQLCLTAGWGVRGSPSIQFGMWSIQTAPGGLLGVSFSDLEGDWASIQGFLTIFSVICSCSFP